MNSFEMMQKKAEQIAKKLRAILPRQPQIAIVLGSGWSGIVKLLENTIIIPYSQFEEMPKCSVAGDEGNFIYGEYQNKAIFLLQGRFHLYEGYDVHTVVLPIQIIQNLQIQKLLLTNASGAINQQYSVGDIMLLDGHINFTMQNPLVAVPATKSNPIFIDMSTLYKNSWQTQVENTLKDSFALQKGVYLQTLGPSYETKEEVIAFRTLGADAVGMSTVLEAIYAHYLKLKVVALAFISNMATDVQAVKQAKAICKKTKEDNIWEQEKRVRNIEKSLQKNKKVSHQEVLENSQKYLQKLTLVIESICKLL